MRVLGVDPGSVRIGLALSDPLGKIASPLLVLTINSAKDGARKVASEARKREVDLVVVGLPLQLSGEEGYEAQKARSFMALLERRLPIPVKSFDERLSSKAAKDALREGGMDSRAQRGRLDSIAAAIMLQSFLDMQIDGRD